MIDPDYEVFVRIVEAGGLSGAGRVLRLSPASVSKRLARLEDRLGLRLIHRTTRRISLTPEGEVLYRDLAGALAELKAAEERVLGLASRPSGPLRLTAPTSFGRLYLGPCLAAFLAADPLIELQLDLSDLFEDLTDGAHDLAIRITSQPGSAVTAHRLAGSPRVLCAAPAYLAAHGTPESLAALARHRLLAADGQMPWNLTGPDGQTRHSGRSAVRTNSSEMVRELALAGAGIALRSLWDVWQELADGRLVRILAQHAGSGGAAVYAVHTPRPRVSAGLAALVAHLQAWFSVERWPEV
jgi:DNA-binding transcriptional LysR family regulator